MFSLGVLLQTACFIGRLTCELVDEKESRKLSTSLGVKREDGKAKRKGGVCGNPEE